eukprot:TRINITY_DN13805_c2_g1_i1.p1 TRINITY_DN13805_c2_g1~~TRINITY_DN13805_c2_g1_i1.p1  ORF type:complete len:520 (-),score=55.93 TRINITY_DN13805_c2_g1_i1:164-1723(-)
MSFRNVSGASGRFHTVWRSTNMTTQCAEVAGPRPPDAPRSRLVSLDMLRGLTMVIMLLVDFTGGGYPSIDHALWNGIHLADFVMPFFLWVSGVSMSISLRVKPGQSRITVFRTAMSRAFRLFVLGLIVQGGCFQSVNGYKALNLDLTRVRIMGILQRIALVFAINASVELFLPKLEASSDQQTSQTLLQRRAAEDRASPEAVQRSSSGHGWQLFRRNAPSWIIVLCFVALGTGLTYGVTPPASWPGCAAKLYACGADDAGSGTCVQKAHGEKSSENLRNMGCSGPGYWDTKILGVNHVYISGSNVSAWPPKFGFDPEGFVTTMSAVFAMHLGLHVGQVWGLLKDPRRALTHWTVLGLVLLVAGLLLSAWIPMNKRLWSPSYGLFMSGAATVAYACFFGLIDATALHPPKFQAFARVVRILLTPLQWLGANCILFFVLSDCCGVISFLMQSVTWGYPPNKNNIVSWFQETVLMDTFRLGSGCTGSFEHCGPALMAFVWIEIIVWVGICGILFQKNIFWKI